MSFLDTNALPDDVWDKEVDTFYVSIFSKCSVLNVGLIT